MNTPDHVEKAPGHVGKSRRQFLAGSGALVVSFSLAPKVLHAQAQSDLVREEPQNRGEVPVQAPALPGSLEVSPLLDSWIRIDGDGGVTVFTGKVELGQGIKTALIQVAAEELVIDPARIRLVTADTSTTPNEGYTAGSQSMQYSGTAILNAAAQARAILTGVAARQWSVPAAKLTVEEGVVVGPAGQRASYASLVTGKELHVRAEPRSPLRDPAKHAVIGQSMRRVDIPAKVTGGEIYVQDLRLPGMVHARVVRPPSYGARLQALDSRAVEKMPGVLKIVRNGSYLAVIAEREYQAIEAMRSLAVAATWTERAGLPPAAEVHDRMQGMRSKDNLILGKSFEPITGDGALRATYRRPYHMHASIGPSCAVGLADQDGVTVWTHTQGVYPLREAIAEMLRQPPERVRCIHMEGSGCYGQNGADDAGADAALIATAFPGRPVRVQWMREDEHTWEPYGSAMISKANGRVDGNGKVAGWRYEVWSHSHLTRPGPAGNLLPAWHLEKPFEQPVPSPLPQPAGGGDRNAIPTYRFNDASVLYHFIPQMPVRVSALRALGGYMNVFSTESFVDELAASASIDPVEFRLRHLEDPRAREVVQVAADRFGWSNWSAGGQAGRGRGFAYARYKTLAAYLAIAVEVQVDGASGGVRVVRAVSAIDSGQAVNPDGIRNQTEGGIIQSISWTLFEQVTFDDTRITSRNWSTYPILRFTDLPDSIEVHIVDRPGAPFLGTGEAAQGPAAAALANAVADAIGERIRDLPLLPDRVMAAMPRRADKKQPA